MVMVKMVLLMVRVKVDEVAGNGDDSRMPIMVTKVKLPIMVTGTVMVTATVA